MNFQELLLHRAALLQHARLANLAFAYDRLRMVAARFRQAGIVGCVTLHPVDPEAERFLPALVAHASSQAVIDEHFLDEDVAELSDVLAFLDDEGVPVELTFAAEDIEERWLPSLRGVLERNGLVPPWSDPASRPEDSRSSQD
jgi:hypothetical protein